MVCLVSPFITKGLTIILEYALALTLRLLFLLLILLPVTRLTSITILMMHILFAFEIIHVEACIYGLLLALSLCQVNHFGYIAILILTTRYCRFLRILYINEKRDHVMGREHNPFFRWLAYQLSLVLLAIESIQFINNTCNSW